MMPTTLQKLNMGVLLYVEPSRSHVMSIMNVYFEAR